MRRLFSLLLFGMLSANSAYSLDVTTEVTSAIVFKDGADVTRRGEVSLPAGTTTVRLVALPPNIDDYDVRLSAEASDVRIGQVSARSVPRSEAYNTAFAQAERRVQEQQLVLQAIEDSDEAARLELRFLQGFAEGYSRDAGVQGVSSSVDPNNWQSALTLLREGTEAAKKRIRDNTLARVDAQNKLRRLTQERDQLVRSQSRESVVTVDLYSPTAQTTTLLLSYLTEDAGWGSEYEARVDSDAETLDMLHIARVGQSTDEDWRGVQLTLSAREVVNQDGIEWPDSEYLNLYSEKTRSRFFEGAGGVDADSLQEIVVTGSRITPEDIADVGSYAVTYNIPGRVNVTSSDDAPDTFDVDRYEQAVSFSTVLIPLTSPLAELEASFEHSAQAPIQESTVRVYLDGSFVGSQRKLYVRPGELMSLSLGEDPFLQVRVLPQGEYEQKRGVIRRRQFETEHTIYEITNRRTESSAIEVYGRYPVSENKAITVAIDDAATPPDEVDVYDQPGLILWRKELGAQETWRITQRYTVSYPEGEELERDYY
ncbi:MAG: mucoidy inhibitor MuiA family protein [Pseudomonadota bacterium]